MTTLLSKHHRGRCGVVIALAFVLFGAPVRAQCGAPRSVRSLPDAPPVLDEPAAAIVARAAATEGLPTTDPSRPAALLELVEAYRATGATDELVRVAAVFLRDHPDAPGADVVVFRLGHALSARRDHERARVVYLRLLRSYPTSPYVADAYAELGDFYLAEGDHAAAQQFFERARDLGGRHAAYFAYGLAWALAGLRDRGALAAFDQAVAHAAAPGALVPPELRRALASERGVIAALLHCP